MKKKLRELRTSMSFNIIGAVVFLLAVFGAAVCVFGFMGFAEVFKSEYTASTYHMAYTAATLVNGDHLDAYLAGGEEAEYRRTAEYLDGYCKAMNVTMVYVIRVDRSDYGRFVSVFNPVNNAVDNSSYTEWELGHRRDTTNDEYRRKYRAVYEQTAEFETVYRTRPTDGQHPHITTLVPVKDSAGEVAAILCMQRPVRELNDAMRPYTVNVAVLTIILSLFSAAFAALYIKTQVIAPVKRTSDEATRFARERTKGAPLGEISKFKDLSLLADSVDTMESDMVKYIEDLTAATAERERLGAELSVASKIQENSIPNTFPAFPERAEFSIHASMTPAKEVGGDFYNFFLIDDDHLAVFIGDVSGKGIPGALFMMVTNILLSDRTKMGGSPAEILTFVNNRLCEHNTLDMFVTLWMGIFEISTGRIVAANAGHDDAAVCRKGGGFELFKTKHGLAAGAMSGVTYRNFELELGKGDKLFLYTDGVPEATDGDNRMFTITRMLEALDAHKDLTPEEILGGVRRSVNRFVGDAPQFDDLTMLCIERARD